MQRPQWAADRVVAIDMEMAALQVQTMCTNHVQHMGQAHWQGPL